MDATDEKLLAEMTRLHNEAKGLWQKLDDAAEELCRIGRVNPDDTEKRSIMHAVIYNGRAPQFAFQQLRKR